jgi:hypothetical protein
MSLTLSTQSLLNVSGQIVTNRGLIKKMRKAARDAERYSMYPHEVVQCLYSKLLIASLNNLISNKPQCVRKPTAHTGH